jgi:hypothetical protein
VTNFCAIEPMSFLMVMPNATAPPPSQPSTSASGDAGQMERRADRGP